MPLCPRIEKGKNLKKSVTPTVTFQEVRTKHYTLMIIALKKQAQTFPPGWGSEPPAGSLEEPRGIPAAQQDERTARLGAPCRARPPASDTTGGRDRECRAPARSQGRACQEPHDPPGGEPGRQPQGLGAAAGPCPPVRRLRVPAIPWECGPPSSPRGAPAPAVLSAPTPRPRGHPLSGRRQKGSLPLPGNA